MNWNFFKELLCIDSTSGKEREVAQWLLTQLEAPVVESMEVGDGTLNLFLKWGTPKVVFCTHMDTVPPYIEPGFPKEMLSRGTPFASLSPAPPTASAAGPSPYPCAGVHMSSGDTSFCDNMQHGAGEIPGEEEVGAAAHHQDGLGQGVPVQGREIRLFRHLHIQGAVHTHPEGVPGGEVVVCSLRYHRLRGTWSYYCPALGLIGCLPGQKRSILPRNAYSAAGRRSIWSSSSWAWSISDGLSIITSLPWLFLGKAM